MHDVSDMAWHPNCLSTIRKNAATGLVLTKLIDSYIIRLDNDILSSNKGDGSATNKRDKSAVIGWLSFPIANSLS
jgi:hypothetical protein